MRNSSSPAYDPFMTTKLIPAFFAIIGLIFSVTGTTASAAQAGVAAQPIEQLQSSLVAAMKAGSKLDYQARYQKLNPVVARAFDFPFIAKLVLGPDWDKLSADQQRNFVVSLDKLSTSSYAKEFDSYAGQSFVFIGERDVPGGKLERYVFKTGDRSIHFDYQMRQSGGGWKIANVIVDGVSDLALKRGQYRKLFGARGYKGLIAWIDKQVAANAG